MTQEELAAAMLALESDRLKIERERLQLSEERLALEREKLSAAKTATASETKKKDWTGPSIVLSTFLALLTLLYNDRLQRDTLRENARLQRDIESQTAADAFKLKVAEIVMNADGPESSNNKAVELYALFPKELKQDFIANVTKHAPPPPDCQQLVGDADSKEALIKMLAEYPARRQQIINDWSAVFTDEWVKFLKTSNPCTRP